MHYWLFKSEPDTFSIETLAKCPKKISPWEGVRNYQVRNMLRDDIKIDDLAFFYHSSCAIPGIAGIVKVIKNGYADDTQFDKNSMYYDEKSSLQNPRWYRVDVQLVEIFPRLITLTELRQHPSLKDMLLLRKGSRLSITPVTKHEWQYINKI